jgi:cobalamin biosynthesis protein CbiG
VCGIVPKLCFLNENYRKVFHEKNVLARGQGARVEIRRKSWLKQLRVAISTSESVPTGSSPQNSRTNFVDLPKNTRSFKEFTKIATKARLIRVLEKQ